MMKKTLSATPKTVSRTWVLADATNQITGRFASQIATLLRGKHKPSFTPHIDVGDFVVVIHADKLQFSGKKESDKLYWHYTGFPGGERSISPQKQRAEHPSRILYHAVKGMLPKGPLGRKMLKKLKIYTGPSHPHQAQNPKPIDSILGAHV